MNIDAAADWAVVFGGPVVVAVAIVAGWQVWRTCRIIDRMRVDLRETSSNICYLAQTALRENVRRSSLH